MKYIYLILLSVIVVSCNSQNKKTNFTRHNSPPTEEATSQIGEYVVSIFEDSKGNLWFGTLEKGIAMYNGHKLKYFTMKDGLPSNRVTGIIEDSKGIFWLMTGEGLSNFDGRKFTNYTIKANSSSNLLSNLFIDSQDNFWIGTWGGVYRFDGKEFVDFPIPYPKVETQINKDTKNWITEITEDSNGNIWIGRDGYGACKYDGKSFTHLLKRDGLHSNNVTGIEIDSDDNIWFGTRVAEKDNPDPKNRKGKGGVNKMTNNKILSFPKIKGFNNSDVYGIYEDNIGNVWISTISNGVYRYNAGKFENFEIPISIMGILNDKNGNLWFGGAGGLYRINKDGAILNVTTKGPWK
ncbi:MAG: two-component regulator propeller domain-containing protein [Saprospiraceae bacterium]